LKMAPPERKKDRDIRHEFLYKSSTFVI